MEMGKEEFGGCANKNGCAVGYDYCTKSKAHGKRCGPCVVTDKHQTGQCTEPNIDKEQAIVDSLSEEELLSIKIDAFVTVMEAGNTKNSCSRKSCAAAVAASGYDYCTAGNTKWSTPMCGPCDMDTGHCSWPPSGFNIDKERTIVDSLSKEELLDIVAEVMDGERFNPVDKATSSANKAAHKATSAANGASKKATAAADNAADKATAAADKAAEAARKAACGSHCD